MASPKEPRPTSFKYAAKGIRRAILRIDDDLQPSMKYTARTGSVVVYARLQATVRIALALSMANKAVREIRHPDYDDGYHYSYDDDDGDMYPGFEGFKDPATDIDWFAVSTHAVAYGPGGRLANVNKNVSGLSRALLWMLNSIVFAWLAWPLVNAWALCLRCCKSAASRQAGWHALYGQHTYLPDCCETICPGRPCHWYTGLGDPGRMAASIVETAWLCVDATDTAIWTAMTTFKKTTTSTAIPAGGRPEFEFDRIEQEWREDFKRWKPSGASIPYDVADMAHLTAMAKLCAAVASVAYATAGAVPLSHPRLAWQATRAGNACMEAARRAFVALAKIELAVCSLRRPGYGGWYGEDHDSVARTLAVFDGTYLNRRDKPYRDGDSPESCVKELWWHYPRYRRSIRCMVSDALKYGGLAVIDRRDTGRDAGRDDDADNGEDKGGDDADRDSDIIAESDAEMSSVLSDSIR